MKPLHYFLFTLSACTAIPLIASNVPVAPVRVVTEALHGVEVQDPYRYFEERDNEEVDMWARKQSAYALEYLQSLPKREALYQRLLEVDAEFGAEVYSITYGANGTAYFLKRALGESLAKLYRKTPAGVLELLLDPSEYGSGEQPASIKHFSVSPNEEILAVGIDTGGSENASMFVFDLNTRETIGNPLPRARWNRANWLPDSSAFFFNQLQNVAPEGDPQETFQKSRVFLYTIDTLEKVPIFGYGLNPEIAIPSEHLSFVFTLSGCDWAFANVETGVSGERDLYVAPLAKVRDATTHWKPIAKMVDQIGSLSGQYVAVHGDSLLLLSRKDAPNGRILKVNIHAPDIENAEVIYDARRGVIQSIAGAKDAVYVKVLEGGPSSIIRLPHDALDQPQRVPLPRAGRVRMNSVVPARSGIYFNHGSWNQPSQHYHYDALSQSVENTGLVPAQRPEICDELEVKQVNYRSHDGIEVSMSIVHKKGLPLDGRNPALLVGYGAYGITLEPSLWKSNIPFLENGGVFAVAHVRGGGAYGDEWRLAGYKATKPNTWKDLIAAAEYLIDEQYTQTALLTASGRSAGGITVGRAITERPDLFGSAVIGVGVSDAVRMETTPNGVPNIPEFGTVQNEDEFLSLLEMSSYHHVVDGVEYPRVLIVHGANDTRVELWQSLKMAARLQAATSSGAPILLRIDYGSGHGRGSSADQRKQVDADTIAFILSNSAQAE